MPELQDSSDEEVEDDKRAEMVKTYRMSKAHIIIAKLIGGAGGMKIKKKDEEQVERLDEEGKAEKEHVEKEEQPASALSAAQPTRKAATTPEPQNARTKNNAIIRALTFFSSSLSSFLFFCLLAAGHRSLFCPSPSA